MPTIIRQHGFEIRILTDDHEPPHVHCVRGEAKFIVDLETLAVRKKRGTKTQDIRDGVQIVAEHTKTLLENWRLIHG